MDSENNEKQSRRLSKSKKAKIFNKEFSLGRIISIYAVLGIVLIVSFIFCSNIYVNKQQLQTNKIVPVTLADFIDNDKITAKNGQLNMSLTNVEFNQLLKSEVHQATIPSLKQSKILDFQYDPDTQQGYFQVKNKKGKLYSFVCKTEMKFSKEKFILELSDYRLGKWKSRVLGNYYKWNLGMPSSIKLPQQSDQDFFYVNNYKNNSGDGVEITFSYNYEKLKKRMDTYKEHIDGAKIQLYKNKKTISTEILDLFNKKETTKNDAAEYIGILEANKENLSKTALLLDEDGIYEISDDFLKLYDKGMNVDKIIEKSASDLDQNLRAYHLDFSGMLLRYLYDNPNYYVEDDKIYVNGEPLTSKKIFALNNYKKLYDVKIKSTSKEITAFYKINDKTISKTILRKE